MLTLRHVQLRSLIGSGDRIMLFTLPFLAVALAIHLVDPSRFAIDASSATRLIAAAVLVTGLVVWAWSVALIVTRVPRGELITTGPYTVVKHPLYTSVGLLVIPAAGILLGTWLGLLVGVGVYVGSRLFAPAEEAELSSTFGPAWDDYRDQVLLPWI
jgi:protein-S-isoprenylcysteine O-methyltransferase Ste14